MRRLLKFLHTIGAIGYLGGLAAYGFILANAPPIDDLAGHAAVRQTLASTSTWVILPGLYTVLLSGLLALIVHHPFMEARWVWVKAVSGLLLFESSLAAIDAPAQRAARLSEKLLAGNADSIAIQQLMHQEWLAWYVLAAIAVANVALGIWRPRLEWRQQAQART